MKIVLWGTYDTGKPRIRILRDGMRALGIEVHEIHAGIWEDIGDKSSLRGVHKWMFRGLRLLAAYPRLVWRYLHAPEHDLVLVSYPGQLDVLVARLFLWIRHKPLVLDWFISAYDTIVKDRKLLGARSPLAWLLWGTEWLGAHAATASFMDTAAHARRMEGLFRLPSGSIGRVWVGAEARMFQPRPAPPAMTSPYLRVLFYGQFIPLHGVETIIEAARLTREEPIRWTLIGRGQQGPYIRRMLAEDPLPHLEWIEWVEYDALPDHIAESDVCLGIFGSSCKAASVIPNKVFQVIAAGRPLISRDSSAIRELLVDAPPCVSLIPAGDAAALADAVRRHVGSGRNHVTQCHAAIRSMITPAAVGHQLCDFLAQRFGQETTHP